MEEETKPFRLGLRVQLLIVVVIAGGVYSQARFNELPERGDTAIWDYFAQVISRGGVPYRDVVDNKAPLSAYIGAAAIVMTRPFGLRDIYALRLAYIILAALTVGATFLTAELFFENRRVAILSAAVMLTFNSFIFWNSAGIQPKTVMVLFGLASLCALVKERPFACGAAGIFSALCWQPGLLFNAAAFIAETDYFRRWRNPGIVALILGALLPLAAFIIYFTAAGALKDFYTWTIDYNASVYAPRGLRSPAASLGLFSKIISKTYSKEVPYFFIGLAGFFLAAFATLSRKGGLALRGPHKQAILVAPLLYLAFCFINLQAGADLIPLLPFVAIFSALALCSLFSWITEVVARRSSAGFGERFGRLAFIGLIALICVTNLFDKVGHRRSRSLRDQDAEVARMKDLLMPGDEIFVNGPLHILVLAGLPNASKYIYLARGEDEYLRLVEPGGFEGWFESLKARRPKIIAFSRMKPVHRKEDFMRWAREEYVQHKGKAISYYVRKD
jgi:DolP-mannose mannosyltransferase